MNREQMNIVIVGHVDHGKSTVIGRLLADTGSLPDGKLESVKENCKRNSKPFEYAFLLDALKDEQAQGITIDTARCFFGTDKRDYIILDAPGHIEFLKNMVTGASRAEAALLVIDANEGIKENSKRHGHMVSMLGIKQVSVLVNKMDLVDYSQDVFENIKSEYTEFLKEVNITPTSFIPISAMAGDNIIGTSEKTKWYKDHSVLEQVDSFTKAKEKLDLPFRFPVQDIYKFTASGDDRRIVAGTVESGTIKVGDEVTFLPSGKGSKVTSVEEFNKPKRDIAKVGESAGFTLETQIYIKPGELMVINGDNQPQVSSRFKANIFWVGRDPLILKKNYKLKIGTNRVSAKLVKVLSVLDASDLSSDATKQQVDRHDVAEVVFETSKPIAFDSTPEMETTGRFVIVDNYEISGGGIVLEKDESGESYLKEHIKEREDQWEKGPISASERASFYRHGSKFIVFTGTSEDKKKEIAFELERQLFNRNYKVYYLGMGNIKNSLESDFTTEENSQDSLIRRFGELARIMTDSGQIFISSVPEIDDYDINKLKLLNQPNEILVINIGDDHFTEFKPDIRFDETIEKYEAIQEIYGSLKDLEIIPDYVI